MNILAISASPVAGGHTEQLLALFAERAFALGADVNILRLVEHPAPPVSGKEKWIADPFWAGKMENCDAFVVATPTYWFGPPAPLKAWIDGLSPLAEDYRLEGKIGGFIVYGPEGGASNLAQYLGLVANHMGIWLPPYSLIWQEGSHKNGNNAWVYKTIPFLAESMIDLDDPISAHKEHSHDH